MDIFTTVIYKLLEYIYIFTQGPRVENKEQHELKEKY